MTFHVALDAIDELPPDERIDEVGCAHLNRGGAGNHELEHVGRARNAAHADDRNVHRPPALVNHAHGNRPDRRAAEATDDVREFWPASLDVDGHREEGVHQRDGVRAGIFCGLGNRGDVGDVRGQLGDYRQARDLLDGGDHVECAVQAASERDATLLDVRAGDVQLERVDAFGVRQNACQLDVFVESAPADVDDIGRAQAAQLGQLLVDVALHADPLQPDRVEHAGWRF